MHTVLGVLTPFPNQLLPCKHRFLAGSSKIASARSFTQAGALRFSPTRSRLQRHLRAVSSKTTWRGCRTRACCTCAQGPPPGLGLPLRAEQPAGECVCVGSDKATDGLCGASGSCGYRMPGTEPLVESQPLKAQPQNLEFIDASSVKLGAARGVPPRASMSFSTSSIRWCPSAVLSSLHSRVSLAFTAPMIALEKSLVFGLPCF
jgi:hypothetical protein